MDKELEFLEAYLAWVNNGAPEPNEHDFCKDWGICVLYSYYANMLSKLYIAIPKYWFGDQKFPFNNEDENQYVAEHNKTLNPKRIQWVKDRISFLKNEII